MRDVNEILGIDAAAGGFLLTRRGELVAAVEIDGIDPASLDDGARLRAARAAESVFSALPASVSVSQYQIRRDAEPLSLRPRRGELAERLRISREKHLAERGFLSTRLVQFLAMDIPELSAMGRFQSLVSALSRAPFSAAGRAELAAALSAGKSLEVSRAAFESARRSLGDAVDRAAARWDAICGARRLDGGEMLDILAFLCRMPSERGAISASIAPRGVPIGSWLPNGDISAGWLGGLATIRFDGAEAASHVRIAALTAFGDCEPGHWTLNAPESIALLPFPHILTLRWQRFTPVQSALLFERKKREIQRDAMDVGRLIAAAVAGRRGEQEEPAARTAEKAGELDRADAMRTFWTRSSGHIMTWARDAETLRARCGAIQSAFDARRCKLVWEESNRLAAWAAAWPSGPRAGGRATITNSDQNAALCLIHRPAAGVPEVPGGEEPLGVFASADGSAFHYHPNVGGRCLAIGIGPTRSGKTYAKNSLALSSVKYGGRYFAVDVDAGTEPLARLLGDDGAYFRFGANEPAFNLFHAARGADDAPWRDHFLRQLARMYAAGGAAGALDDADARKTAERAVDACLSLDPPMRTLSHFAAQLPRKLSQPLSRFLRADPGAGRPKDGAFAALADAERDAAHSDARFVVFNLCDIKDSEDILGIAYSEIFFRLGRVFEDESARSMPKFLDIDEAHAPLSDPEFQAWITRGARTWNKFLVHVSLWSQSVEEFAALPQWEALRSAAGTLLFGAWPDAPEGLLSEALSLSPGEIAGVRALTPRRELFVVQRERRVAKNISLDNDAFTHCLLDSTPHVAEARARHCAELGLVAGVEKTLREFSRAA